MPHLSNSEAEEFLDKEHKVLDHGFVRLVDYMGNDQRVVDAARVSYQAGTTRTSSDRDLIRYLLRHKHTTPFEKVRFEFHIKLPIFVMRQLVRHRMASINEESARYSVMKEEFYFPTELRQQSSNNKQGSGCAFVGDHEGEEAHYRLGIQKLCVEAYTHYNEMITGGVAREMARMVLPVNLYTEFYWTIDLWNLMHFLKLRLDSHAQWEIQEYAKPVEMCARAVAPWSFEAWTDYVNDAQNFSRMEVGAIRSMFQTYFNDLSKVEDLLVGSGMVTRTPSGLPTREFKECLDKFGILDEQGSVPVGSSK